MNLKTIGETRNLKITMHSSCWELIDKVFHDDYSMGVAILKQAMDEIEEKPSAKHRWLDEMMAITAITAVISIFALIIILSTK